MAVLIVIENPANWSLEVPEADIVSAREYLTNSTLADLPRAKVFNMCRAYGYQSVGYYVSLLATARGHRPLPSVTTIQDLRLSSLLRIVSEDLEDILQHTLARLKSKRFQLSIYFGRNMARRYDRLCQALFNHFPAPFLRAEFVRGTQWRINSLRPIATAEIPNSHRPFVTEQAKLFFSRRAISPRKQHRYDIAILLNRDEVDAPSNERAINRFARAAQKFDMDATIIGKEDFGRIGEFDALFIRETTRVNHHTYRFASRAEAEGLVVIDDPESIVRCTNKVYQAELFEQREIATPPTMIVHRDNAAQVSGILGLPCVLKKPDSSFSLGVVKAETEDELKDYMEAFFEQSELIVAQQWAPSDFDWRVGVLAGRALYVCKYYMAPGHWQIQKNEGEKLRKFGRVDTIAVEDAPQRLVKLAVRAAKLIGNGLYGVDIKQVKHRFLLMEVNDNPSIDAGYEDRILKDDLYMAIMRFFYERLEQRGRTERPL